MSRVRRFCAEAALRGLPARWAEPLRRMLRFRNEFKQFVAAEGDSPRLPVRWADRRPCPRDRAALAGFDPQYFYHLAWAARVLAETRPPEHVDISSHLDFCAVVSAFVPVRFYDLHALPARLDGLTAQQADLTRLPFADDSVPSLSCLHVIEHVGLGRYGDPLDPDGDLKAMSELRRVLAPGGQLLIAVPVGRPRVQFNAHRVYAFRHVQEAMTGLRLREFALVPDDQPAAGLVRPASSEMADAQDCACGCFWWVK